MMVWKEGHAHVASAQVLALQSGVDVLHNIIVRQHDSLGHGGCARSEEDDGRRFGVDRQILILLKIFMRRVCSLLPQLRQAQVAFQIIHADVLADFRSTCSLQCFHLLFMGRIKDEHVGMTPYQRGLQFFVGKPFVQRNANAQTAQDSEVAFHPFFPVFSDDCDAFPFHTAAQQCSTQLDDTLPESGE